MRYLGNKESILTEIIDLLKTKNLLNSRYTFFDAFCGTGTVANGLKNYYNLIINDNLKLATTFSLGRIISQSCKFEKLGFDPIVYLNKNKNLEKGFFSSNYAPTLSGRMYFNDFNAGRIDFFRTKIEEWNNDKLVDDFEYNYLLGCLLESVSKVANIAGVYGAYLKKWDPRALKEIKFIEIETFPSDNEPKVISFNNNIGDIIQSVECDILYLDPPYTKNKYSVQYHLLETLIKNDNPQLKGITGTRNFTSVSDNWSKQYSVEIEFENTIRRTKAKHILFSYSSAGLMTKEYIVNILKRYGYLETLYIKEIPYKKYRNARTLSENDHLEYLFYIELKPKNEVIYCCPLNYMGGKSNIIKYFKSELSTKSTFFDLMGGGFNVGINGLEFKKYIYNDINFIVKDLIAMFRNEETLVILRKIDNIIKKYNLKKCGKEEYIAFRTKYNTSLKNSSDSLFYLFTLILYGFQQQMRFNSKHEFNNPVGESGYNESIKEKIVSFSARIKELDISFSSQDFSEYEKKIDKDSLVYLDPPYLITLGSYNDGKRGFKGWSDEDEKRLISFLDTIKTRGCRILLSNILEYRGKKNTYLEQWINKNKPEKLAIKIRGREEILIKYDSKI